MGGGYEPIEKKRYKRMGLLVIGCLSAIFLLVEIFQQTSGSSLVVVEGVNPHPHYVVDLPDLPDEYAAPMYSGFVPVNEEESGSSLYYWLFSSEKEGTEEEEEEVPLVIWLNGGPGASSLTGALLENGPLRLNTDGTMTYNEFGWTKEVSAGSGEERSESQMASGQDVIYPLP